jgi:DNA mismatch repair protein MutS2
LPGSIIEKARSHRSERETQLAEHLAKIEHDLQSLDHERRLLARERETLAEAAAKLQSREHDLKNREETFRRRLDQRIEERLREARHEVDAVVERLKARTDSLMTDASRGARLISTGDTGAARADARAALDAIGERLRSGSLDPVAPGQAMRGPGKDGGAARPVAVGDRVLVGAFGLEGIVKALSDRDAEVDVRGKRLRTRLDEIQVLGGPAPAQKPAPVRVNVDLQPREGSLTELNVIGCHVDEALARAERFLDEALLGELKTVRVIHGYGTGQLRRAIAGFLQTHPLVAHFSPAPAEQGGGGVTVVELKD